MLPFLVCSATFSSSATLSTSRRTNVAMASRFARILPYDFSRASRASRFSNPVTWVMKSAMDSK